MSWCCAKEKVSWDLDRFGTRASARFQTQLGQVQQDPLAVFNRIARPRFKLGHISNGSVWSSSAMFLVTFVVTFKIVFWSFFSCFLRGFWNLTNATSICIWDHSKALENQFLGTFKSCQAVDNNFIFIFMKFLFLAKTGFENGRYRSQKGLKSELSSLLDP